MSFALMAAPYLNISAKNSNAKNGKRNNQITKCSARKKKTIKNQPSSKNIEVQNIIDKIHNLGSDGMSEIILMLVLLHGNAALKIICDYLK